MNTYKVTFKDEATYTIKAETQEKAIIKASDSWERRVPPTPTVKKKVKKTIHYPILKQYKQDILVDDDLDEDEIIELWLNDEIETLTKSEPDDNIYNDERGTWVE